MNAHRYEPKICLFCPDPVKDGAEEENNGVTNNGQIIGMCHIGIGNKAHNDWEKSTTNYAHGDK